MQRVQRIAVVGATGFTGRLVVAALERKGGAAVRLVGRNREKLARLLAEFRGAEVWPVAEWTSDALVEALTGCSAVISCAGPFLEAGRPVAEAAVRVDAPYCDSAGEQPFIKWAYERLDAQARLSGIPVVPGFGYDFVPGDLGAAIAAEGLEGLERVDVVYWQASTATSRGTRRSIIGVFGEPGYQWVDGRLHTEGVGRRQRSIVVADRKLAAVSIPAGESLMVPRHLDVPTVVTYTALPVPRRVLPLLALLRLRAPRRLAGALAARAREPGERERRAPFACHVQATAADGRRRAVLVEGRDLYGFTAEALAELGSRMCAGAVDAVGACSPAQAVEPAAFLAAMDCTVREVEPQ